MARLFVGPALAAQTLTGGQAGYKVGTGSKESSTSANKYQRTFVYVWRSGSGNVKTIIVPTSCGTEHTTTEKGCVITVAGAAGDFSVLENDRIVVEIWFDIRDSTTSYTSYLYYDGTTDAVEATTDTNVAGFFYCPQTLNLPVTAKNFSDVVSGSDAFSNPFRAMPFGETGHGTEAFNNPFRAMGFSDVCNGTDGFAIPLLTLGFSDAVTGADVFTQGNLTADFTRLYLDSSTTSTVHFHCPDCGEPNHSVETYWFNKDRGSGTRYYTIPNHVNVGTGQQCVGNGKIIKLEVSTTTISRPDELP